jgi:spore germination cell wall hydrolase CwlJ-like protein
MMRVSLSNVLNSRARLPIGIALLLVLVAILALVRGPLPDGTRPRASAPRARAMPAAAADPVPQPVVEPLELLETTPDRARAINAAIPLIPGRVTPARPFRFAGSAEDRANARACLASAAWYEAGDDPVGQPAVVQVVLNRLRHPAYPKTICGVVFQGSERRTGCQFSFSCDGAMARRPSEAAWKRAEGVADKALTGFVDKRVGNATHYHTDWVVPYWSGTLDKIAQVGTHLFFRWRGYWGTPAAFRGRYAGGETVDRRVPGYVAPPAGDMPAGGATRFGVPEMPGDSVQYLQPRPALTIPGVPAAALKGNIVRLGSANGSEYALELTVGAGEDHYPAVAAALCRERPVCTVAGWIDPDRVPLVLPMPMQALRAATFLYRRRGDAPVQAVWNCGQAPRADKTQCMPGTE